MCVAARNAQTKINPQLEVVTMSLKAALQADLAAKGMNLGDLADKLGITQQSVSKWIAKDEIPKDRVEEVLSLLSPAPSMSAFLIDSVKDRLLAAGVKAPPLRNPPQPGEDDDEARFSARISFVNPTMARDYQDRAIQEATARLDRSPSPSNHRVLMGAGRAALWASALDPKLRRNVMRSREINGGLRRFDYLSDSLAMMVRSRPAMDPARLIQAAVPLLLTRANDAYTHCVLALLPPEQIGLPKSSVQMTPAAEREVERRFALVKLDLQALGINVVEFNEAEQLAQHVEEIEREFPSRPIFSYEDFPEDALMPADGD